MVLYHSIDGWINMFCFKRRKPKYVYNICVQCCLPLTVIKLTLPCINRVVTVKLDDLTDGKTRQSLFLPVTVYVSHCSCTVSVDYLHLQSLFLQCTGKAIF